MSQFGFAGVLVRFRRAHHQMTRVGRISAACSAPSPSDQRRRSVMRTPVALPAFAEGMEQAMLTQRYFKHIRHAKTFEELSAEEAQRFRAAAQELPQGMPRELLLRRARQAETACHMSGWLRSPGLQSPK